MLHEPVNDKVELICVCMTAAPYYALLSQIMDADKVLVMDAGQVGEYGPVPELLAKEGGLFKGMVASE